MNIPAMAMVGASPGILDSFFFLAPLAFGDRVFYYLGSGLAMCFHSDADSGSEDTALP